MFRRSFLVGAAVSFAIGSPFAHANQDLRVRIANSYGKGQPAGKALEHFASRISELSNGKIKGAVYHNGSLYSEEKSLRAVQDGTLEVAFASLSNWGPFTKSLRALEAPFLFDNREQFRRLMLIGSPTRERIAKELERDGFVPLMIFETGGFRILGTNRPVKVPKDLIGLKIRVPQSPVPVKFWNAAGASATVVPWSEAYLALGSKAVDGLDTSLATYPLVKLWEVTKFVNNIQYSSVASITAVSGKWWAGLTPEQRTILLKAAKEAEEISVKEEDQEERSLGALLKSHGIEIYQPTKEDLVHWHAVGTKLWDEIPDTPRSRIEELRAAAKAGG